MRWHVAMLGVQAILAMFWLGVGPAAAGGPNLDVTRSEAVRFFQEAYNFKFRPSRLDDGTPILTGYSVPRGLLVKMRGADRLSRIEMFASTHEGDVERGVSFLVSSTSTLLLDDPFATDWLEAALADAFCGKRRQAIVNDFYLRVRCIPRLRLVSVAITAMPINEEEEE